MRARVAWVVSAVTSAVFAAGCGAPRSPSTAPSIRVAPHDRVNVTGLARDIDPCPQSTASGTPESSDEERLASLELLCLGPGAPSVNLAQPTGRPILVNLWATWCGPCRDEMPELQAAYERHRGQVFFLGVDTRDDPQGAVDFLTEVGVTYPQVVDWDGDLLAHLRIPGLPVTVILDAQGKIIAKHVGPLDAETIEGLIDQATS